MSTKLSRIFIYGFPILYGGAGTELYHQIIAWKHMGIDIHLIPIYPAQNEPLYPEMLSRGITVHDSQDWACLQPCDPILCFCDPKFFTHLPDIRQYTRRTVYINCMTWLFGQEKEAAERGLIAMFLYQNELVRKTNMPVLQALNPDPEIRYLTFTPYFHHADFPWIQERPNAYFGCGRISRQDSDKFSSDTLKIYEYFVSPVPKKGLFLGFDQRSEQKIGKPFDWIRTALNQHELSQQEFYRHCEIILQPTDTTENWPRIGFEAMASGSVLIVDNRGGWRQMVEHSKTGWLCNHERDFIFYASKMAYEPNMRYDMASAAREQCIQLGGLQASIDSWEEIFATILQLPE